MILLNQQDITMQKAKSVPCTCCGVWSRWRDARGLCYGCTPTWESVTIEELEAAYGPRRQVENHFDAVEKILLDDIPTNP